MIHLNQEVDSDSDENQQQPILKASTKTTSNNHKHHDGQRRRSKTNRRLSVAVAIILVLVLVVVLLAAGKDYPQRCPNIVERWVYYKGVYIHYTLAVPDAPNPDPKIVIFKYRRRKDSRRKNGHRQDFTFIRVKAITG